jgi:thiol:disulfide interchange protein DsbD
MLVFLMLGLGLALPFLLIGFVPAFARLLPKPGAWMETLKQLLAFPMYATAAWLVWVLAKQRGADAAGLWMAAAIALALGAWAWTRARSGGGRAWLVVALVALLGTAWPLLKRRSLRRRTHSGVACARRRLRRRAKKSRAMRSKPTSGPPAPGRWRRSRTR